MVDNECSTWNMKVPYIHYRDSGATKERVVFGRPDDLLHYNYADRLASEDYQKWKNSKEISGIASGTPRYWQEVLRKYWEDPGLELGCIITAVNQSNGFQYLIFGCKHSKNKSDQLASA